jgi:hypothetical protein
LRSFTLPQIVLSQWEDGDYSGFSVLTYPDSLVNLCRREYLKVKGIQAGLLGIPPSKAGVTDSQEEGARVAAAEERKSKAGGTPPPPPAAERRREGPGAPGRGGWLPRCKL